MKTQTNTETAQNKSPLKALARDSRGLSTVEYIILLVAVVVGCIALWTEIGAHLYKELDNAKDEIGKVKAQGESEGGGG